MADFNIRVIVDPTAASPGIRRVDRGLARLEKRAARITTILGQALGFVGIAAGVREIVRLTDTLTNMENRLRLVTKGTTNLNAVTDELFKIAIRTRTAFDGTATIFARTALSTKNLGITQRETLKFTEALNQAIVLSGVTAQEANAGLIQLSQGIASNVLRGDELRSVLEQLPKVADVIADHMKITRGELRLFGAQGKISAKTIIDAFAAAEKELALLFADTIPTISQSFSVLETQIIKFLGEFNKATGFAKLLSGAILGLANNLDILADFAAIAGTVIATILVKKGILLAVAAVHALTAAIALNPIGFLIIAVIAGVTALSRFSDKIKLTANGLATLEDFGVVAFDAIETAVTNVVTEIDNFVFILGELASSFDFLDDIGSKFINIAKQFEFSFGNMLRFSGFIVDKIIGLFRGLNDAVIAIFKLLPQILANEFPKFTDGIKKMLEDALNPILEKINDFAGKLGFDPIDALSFERSADLAVLTAADVGKAVSDAFNSRFELTPIADKIGELLDLAELRAKALVIPDTGGDKGLDDRPDKRGGIPAALQLQLDALEAERVLLGLGNEERRNKNELLKIEKKLLSANVTLTTGPGSEQEQLLTAIKLTQALRERVAVLDSIRGPQEELNIRQRSLNQLQTLGKITTDELTAALFELRLEQAAINAEQGEGNFASGFLLGIEQMLEAVRNFKTVGGELMADFFTSTSEGIGQAAGQAIIFGQNFAESVGNVARQALSQLIGSFVQLGIEMLLSKTVSSALTATQVAGAASVASAESAKQATTTAAALTAQATLTAASVGQAAIITAAWTAPAALTSLASFGANALPASAGILSTAAVAQSVALIGLADGGMVRGAGGPKSDSIPAMLSDGEFVINAASTKKFRPQIELINKGQDPTEQSLKFAQGGSVTNNNSITNDMSRVLNFVNGGAVSNQANITSTTSNAAKTIMLANGGAVFGSGSSKSDGIPAMLSNGEFVVNAKSASRFRPQLEAINSPTKFANGGIVGTGQESRVPFDAPEQGQTASPTTILNVLDPAIVGDFLSTPEGEDVIINVMRRNSSRIQNSQR